MLKFKLKPSEHEREITAKMIEETQGGSLEKLRYLYRTAKTKEEKEKLKKQIDSNYIVMTIRENQ